jgi:hypothetical protein
MYRLDDILPTAPSSSSSSNAGSGSAVGTEEGIAGDIVLLLECTGNGQRESEEAKINQLFTTLIDESLISNAIISENVQQEKKLWSLRETVPVSLMQCSRQILPWSTTNLPIPASSASEKLMKCGKLYKYDISLSLSMTSQFIANLRDQLIRDGFQIRSHFPTNSTGSVQVTQDEIEDESILVSKELASVVTLEMCNFGHAGDQNLHLNILTCFPCIEAHDIESNTKSYALSDASKSNSYPLSEVISRVQYHLDYRVYQYLIPLRG